MNSAAQTIHQETNIPPLKTKELEVMPFLDKNGGPNFSDSHISQAFRRIVREETLYRIFYDGSVNNTLDFTRFIKDSNCKIFFVKYDGKDAGFFWLSGFKQKSAFINYCFYRDFWGDKALKISELCVNHIFRMRNTQGTHIYDVLLGLTPGNNKLAIHFLLKNGMTIIGKVPGMLYDCRTDKTVDAVFSYRQRNHDTKIKFSAFAFLH